MYLKWLVTVTGRLRRSAVDKVITIYTSDKVPRSRTRPVKRDRHVESSPPTERIDVCTRSRALVRR